jgi:hypothetical protein
MGRKVVSLGPKGKGVALVNAKAWMEKFEEQGEAWTRDQLDTGYFNEWVRPIATKWLDRKRQDREAEALARSAAATSESNELQRRAASAAERAAKAAEDANDLASKANRRATIAIAVSIASAIATATAALIAYLAWVAPYQPH